MIGPIMLRGSATKNSILLVEYAIVSRRVRGTSRTEALLNACKKRVRASLLAIPVVSASVDAVIQRIGAIAAKSGKPAHACNT